MAFFLGSDTKIFGEWDSRMERKQEELGLQFEDQLKQKEINPIEVLFF